MNLPQVYTPAEVAEWLKVPEDTILREIVNGYLKSFRVGNERRVLEAEMLRFSSSLAEPTLVLEQPSQNIGMSPESPDYPLTTYPDFIHTWPSRNRETYRDAKEGLISIRSRNCHVEIGTCSERKAYGRLRDRVLVRIDNYPEKEFVESDQPEGYFFTTVNGIDPGDLMGFKIRRAEEVVNGPGAGKRLVVLVPAGDWQTMVQITLLKRKFKW